MPANIESFYLMIFIAALLGLLLGVTSIANLLLLRRTQKLKSEYDHLEKEVREKLNTLLAEATAKSLDIIKSTAQEASQVVKDTRFFSSETKAQFLRDVQLVREHDKTQFAETLNRVEQEMVDSLKKATQEMETDFKAQIAGFKKSLSQLVEESQLQAKKQAQEYKDSLYNHAEDTLFHVFSALSKELLKRSLTPKDHEALILEAFDEARAHEVL